MYIWEFHHARRNFLLGETFSKVRTDLFETLVQEYFRVRRKILGGPHIFINCLLQPNINTNTTTNHEHLKLKVLATARVWV